jgi:transcriptional regulator with XRE-family HTH domain
MTTQRHPALVALGQQIRQVRRDRGFSQEDFASEVGIDRSYYGAVERGERNIAAINLMRIAAALQVEVGELFPKVQDLRDQLDRAGTPPADAQNGEPKG